MRDGSGNAGDTGPGSGAASRPIIDREAAKRLKIGVRRLRNLAALTGIGHRALIFSEADLTLLQRLMRPIARQGRYVTAAMPTPTKRETKIRRHVAAVLTDRSGWQPLGGRKPTSTRGKRILAPPADK
jgi:hypothetical protein